MALTAQGPRGVLRRLLLLRSLVLLALSLTPAACSSVVGPADANASAELTGLLPSPTRLVSAPGENFRVRHDGADFAPDLPAWHCTADNGSALLSPQGGSAANLQDAALAIYRMRYNRFDPQLSINWDGLAPADRCWLGLANWQTDRWDWQALPSNSLLELGTESPYADSQQRLLVAVVLTSGSARRVVAVSFPADDPAKSFVAQASATLNPESTAFTIHSTNLPDGEDILFGPLEINQPVDNNLQFTWPYRGGTNAPAAVHQSIKTSPGILGLTVAGLVIYGPSNASVFNINGNTYTYDANAAKINGEDQYGGHASPQAGGQYHYHDVAFISKNAWVGVPGFDGVYEQADGHSKLIGWAADGYPIYGPYGYSDPLDPGSSVTRMVSGWVSGNSGPDRPVAVITTAAAASANSEFITLPADPGALGTDPGMRLVEINGLPVDDPVWILNQKNVHYVGGGHPPYMGPLNSVFVSAPVSLAGGDTLKFEFLPGVFIEDNSFADTGTLDRHNGRFCVTPDYPDGTYAYFCTMDDEGEGVYPYMLGQEYYGETQVGGLPGSGYVRQN